MLLEEWGWERALGMKEHDDVSVGILGVEDFLKGEDLGAESEAAEGSSMRAWVISDGVYGLVYGQEVFGVCDWGGGVS